MAKGKWMTLAQARDMLMRERGLTEKEAEAELLRRLRSGELTATGVPTYAKPLARRVRLH